MLSVQSHINNIVKFTLSMHLLQLRKKSHSRGVMENKMNKISDERSAY